MTGFFLIRMNEMSESINIINQIIYKISNKKLDKASIFISFGL